MTYSLANSNGTNTEYIEILTAENRYAVELSRVRELLRWNGAVQIPGASQAVRGAINVRGQIIPVVDLRSALGLSNVDYGVRGVVILLQDGERTLGLLVEAVSQVLELSDNDERVPPSGVIGETEPLAALLRVSDETMFLIDVPKLAAGWLPTHTARATS